MQTASPLGQVSIILVDTKTPANIGATARCMMNMGLSRLVLVHPPQDPGGEAHKLAAGAHGILDKASVYSSLKDAVAGQGLVIGTSRHTGRLRKNVRAPRDMAEEAVRLLERNSVSVVFGNEVNGLERSDLALCHETITIPSSDEFPSLNLSHAVMVVAYELFAAALPGNAASENELAPSRELENFYAHLQKVLEDIEFVDLRHPERMMISLRHLFSRARLNTRDVSILRGILSAVERAARGR